MLPVIIIAELPSVPVTMRHFIVGTLFAAVAYGERPKVNARNTQITNESQCDCFFVDGKYPTFFSEYKFFDFRSLSRYAGVPDSITAFEDNSDAPTTSEYFSQDDWTDTWQLQGWDNRVGNGDELSKDANILMVNSPNNVYLEESDDDDTDSETFLTMRTKRLPGFQAAAEFESTTSDYEFLSIRILARTIGSPGACTAMFTYRDSDTLADVQEADIEILTSGPRDKIQYTNQPSYSIDGDTFPEATSNATMPNDLRWTDWVVHRLDWTPGHSTWYVNDEETASISFQVPRDPAHIHFNAWGNGGGWTGEMPVYDEAYFQIQWIQMVFNRTTAGESKEHRRSRSALGSSERRLKEREDSGSNCQVVCSIDEVDDPADVSVLWESEGLRTIHRSLEQPLFSLVLIALVTMARWH
jgi:hypothetical protein